MVKLIESQLLHWRGQLEQEITKYESQEGKLQEELADLRGKLEAINRLLPKNGNQTLKRENKDSIDHLPDSGQERQSRGKSTFTPVYAYWVPILASLVELGGSAHSDDVIDHVGKKMEKILTPADRKRLPSGVDIRWRNRVAWQRYNMIKQALLKGDSPRGIWEITEEGRKMLGEANKNVPPQSIT